MLIGQPLLDAAAPVAEAMPDASPASVRPTLALPGALRMRHIQLDSRCPTLSPTFHLREALLYCLTGRLRVYDTQHEILLGTYGGRRSLCEQQAHIIRFPAGSIHCVCMLLESAAADCLLISCDAPCNLKATLPYSHTTDTAWHTVGTGTHQRIVGEVPTPPGYHIACGQTIQGPGTTSSWPSHASAEDLARYARGETTWEEYFYVVCEQQGRVQLDGLYGREEPVKASQPLENGAIMRMPLGSHPVTSAPDGWLTYIWAYCGSALQKQYNISSSDVSTYRK